MIASFTSPYNSFIAEPELSMLLPNNTMPPTANSGAFMRETLAIQFPVEAADGGR
ncbi:MAG: hypothetical protein M3R52_01065 [Acidobacteriota bacterium]|nr:hypothetical protein [Acidobacteriota bacterium]